MGFADLVGPGKGGALLVASPLETARLGRSIARVNVATESTVPVEDVLDAVDSSDVDIVVLRYSAERVLWAAALAGGKRVALHADTLVYWTSTRPSKDATLVDAPADGGPFVVEELGADRIDRALLEGLVEDIFAGYGSHYAADPLLPRRATVEGYKEWATRSIQAGSGGTAVVVKDVDDGTEVALATVGIDGPVLEIFLAGVIAGRRGRGVYGVLLTGVDAIAHARGCHTVAISTQAQNSVVQRAWAAHGFKPVAAFETFHLIAPQLRAQLRV